MHNDITAFLLFNFLKLITAIITAIGMITANILYPQSFMVASVKPAPYITVSESNAEPKKP